MQRLRAWAPRASSVSAVVDGVEVPMQADEGGWWTTAEAHPPGTRYGFVLGDGVALPDPRSCYQPDGVEGLSEVVDLQSFAWSDGSWRGVSLAGAVLYEMHVGTFSEAGTFDGAIDHLDHLVDLGVSAVEVMPVNQFPGRWGWGYDGVDLFAPHAPYGGPIGFQRFVDACHSRGLGVILDVVYNHLGPLGNNLARFGPYFSESRSTGWGPAVNFDGPGSDEVRAFVVDNALMWLRDYHVDGLRLDAVHAIVDTSAVHILEELAGAVAGLAAHVRKPLFLIAESDLNDPQIVRSTTSGGYGLDAAWADEWHHALHAALTGERDGYYEDFGSHDALAKALRQAWVYDGVWSAHRGRTFGRSPAGLRGDQFVVCTQNHDQIGNRARGERSSALLDGPALRTAALLLLTSPFVPMIFQGEEWGATTPFQYFTDHPDPGLAEAVREGRRSEFAAFGWDPSEVPDPQDPETFERSKLDWSEPEGGEGSDLLDWYSQLVRLRRDLAAITDPQLAETSSEAERGVVALRRPGLAVLANLATTEVELDVSPLVVVAVSDPGSKRCTGGSALTLAPGTAAVASDGGARHRHVRSP